MLVVFSVLGLGLDSLLAGLLLGSFMRSWRERFSLAMSFGACDAAATLAGSVWPHRIATPSTFVTYLVCALLLAAAARYKRALFYLLPLVLSIDNLFGGVPASSALMAGAESTLMALLGLSLATSSRNLFLASRAEA
ncbi:MAG TPA: hypothetical protein VK763_06175 [Terriglobales bacterium]|jgi:hypothetical protein|nr:hypothetical protein [Terriglobales bacterium]